MFRLRGGDQSQWQAGVALVVLALTIGLFEKLDGEMSRVLWLSLGLLLAARLPPATALPPSAFSDAGLAP